MKHAALLVALLTIALLVAACGRRTAVDPVDTASATTTTAPDNSAAITAAEDALAQAEALLDGLRSDSDAIAGDLAADADAQAQG